jgi:hypothetical protein
MLRSIKTIDRTWKWHFPNDKEEKIERAKKKKKYYQQIQIVTEITLLGIIEFTRILNLFSNEQKKNLIVHSLVRIQQNINTN